MGAWGLRAFENDMASDWVYELEEATDDSFLLETLNAVLEDGDAYLDSDVGAAALAAAEVVAAKAGRPADTLPDEVVAWVASHASPASAALRDRAVAAAHRVLADESELAAAWTDAESAEAWRREVQGLIDRLSG